MQSSDFWSALSNVENKRRREYFQWKNKIQNLKIDYGALSQEEFIARQSTKHRPVTNPEEFMQHLARWESSLEYKRLLMLWKKDQFAKDILDVYDVILQKAKTEPDNATIKNLIQLQEQISKYIDSIEKFHIQEDIKDEDDDDGLDLELSL